MANLSRRDALKVVAAAGAVGVAALPDAWEKPNVEASSLPRFAAASSVPTATRTSTPVPSATSTATATATISPTTTPTDTPTATPDPTIFSENFDSPTAPALPSGWSSALVAMQGQVSPAWTTAISDSMTGASPFSSPNMAVFNSQFCEPGSQARLQMLESYSLVGTTTPQLTFYLFGNPWGFGVSVQAQVSTDDGASWSNVGAAISPISWAWNQFTISLSDYAGRDNVRIGLLGGRVGGGEVSNILIDDLRITRW